MTIKELKSLYPGKSDDWYRGYLAAAEICDNTGAKKDDEPNSIPCGPFHAGCNCDD